jgi:hypothetical protein
MNEWDVQIPVRPCQIPPHEKLSAGDAYELGADYVACNELGAPLDPARLRRVWYRLMREARVPKVKPYTASRHAAASYLINWSTGPGSRRRLSPPCWAMLTPLFTMRAYLHARPEDLAGFARGVAERPDA